MPKKSAETMLTDRKSTRLNSSHTVISYAVFCLRSEEHTSELQSHSDLVCRLLLEKKKHTSELQSHSDLVCRLLLEKKKNSVTRQQYMESEMNLCHSRQAPEIVRRHQESTHHDHN